MTSLQPGLTGLSAGELATGSFSGRDFNVNNSSDFNGLISTINRLPNRAQFYAQFDANGDGTITSAEMGPRLTFNSTAGNPDGMVNYDRTFSRSSARRRRARTA